MIVDRQMPWLQLIDRSLWSTSDNAVECFLLSTYSQQTGGGVRTSRHELRHERIHRDSSRTVRLSGVGDVCRFVCRQKLIVAGTRCVDNSF